MPYSTKGRYALLAMVDIAEHEAGGYVPLKSIAQRQGISEKYLQSILKALVSGKFVVGLRGKGGGYKLTHDPSDYTLAAIMRLMEGEISLIPGLNEEKTLPQPSQYRVLDMWRSLNKMVEDYLEGLSVADLMTDVDPGDNYVI